MNKQYFQVLYEFNRWANARVLTATSALTVEQFTRDLSSSYPSVRDTLTHILSAEWIWLMRWKRVSPTAMFNPAAFPSLDALREKWAEVEHVQMAFVGKLTDDALLRGVSYVNTEGERWKYPLWQIMQHVVNHSTYHRGQVTTLLRQLDAKPAPTDFLVFFDEESARRS